ncbi:expressed protein [Arabidopsis lyrata subsp. lyrata]|uniref:Expressed protein n=2 Tax=Arabidopsis lyrata subsp. lyrata TaxID=81972 RepID=D7LHA0_ARALL|nr:expressed protein [Arabidopsis lyrata subsp. lyrata]
MELYQSPAVRAQQFGRSFDIITKDANSVHAQTGANVAFAAIAENDRRVSHATPPGMVDILSRRGFAPTEPVSRYGVAESDLHLTTMAANELTELAEQAETAVTAITAELAGRNANND